MKASTYLIILILIAPFITKANAQTNVANFTATNLVNSENIELQDFLNEPLVVVLFTNRQCPFSKLYESRIDKLIRDFQSQLPIMLVNPTVGESTEDEIDQIKNMLRSKPHISYYLEDSDRSLVKLMGAEKLPEAYVLRPLDNRFEVIYKGAIDDNPQLERAVNVQYLRQAIENSLKGDRIATSSQRAPGCVIR
ncbi:MAG: redoxin domain-containing protein [Cyclobacteriaceae bacterium]|nr:redoxin domain-containing protein [Cyclobacteriaceae bacterium]MCH8516801.1 redoxin domain-containing protein [Cyclobacteriaceae bacterium]